MWSRKILSSKLSNLLVESEWFHNLIISLQLQKLFANIYQNNQISLNLFTPFSTLTVKDAKKAKDIVGFNDEHVFTLSQAKKNPKGTSELHKELNYDDYCVDFTVKVREILKINLCFYSKLKPAGLLRSLSRFHEN